MMRLPILLIIILTATLSAKSQIISGKVIDSLKLEPIAFVNITLDDGIRGTTSDIEGNFKLSIPTNYTGLIIISHVSYQKVKLPLPYFSKKKLVKLKPSNTVLSELTFVADENPAFRIIRNAIVNRPLHDPDNLQSYQYISYNKFFVTADEPSKLIDSLVQVYNLKERDSLTKKQQSLVSFDSLMKTTHLFMSESVTEKQVLNPDKEKEKLLALQISGFKSPLFTNAATDYQPISFYKDKISLLRKDFINPISKGTFHRYDFYLTDTSFYEADTVYIIQFQPKLKKLFNGLQGVISITSDGYAIKNVIASCSDSLALTGIRIQQNYEKVDGKWFPVQLNTDLNFSKLNLFGRGIKGRQRSFLKEIKINPALSKHSFGDIKIELSRPKQEDSKLFLAKYRGEAVDTKEARTYTLIDSLAKKSALIEKIMESTITQAVPIGFLDIDLNRIIRFNRYERFRLGVGLSTNDRVSKLVKLSGYYGYGFGDQQSKYGGELKLNFNPNRDFFAKLSYTNDIYEAGTSHSYERESQLLQTDALRNLVGNQFDHLQSYRGELGYRPLPDIHASVFISHNQIRPLYDYSLSISGELQNNFTIAETGVSIRYIKKETYFLLNGKKVFFTRRLPIITATIASSLNIFDAKDFNYTYYDLSIRHEITHRTLGKTNIQLFGGLMQGLAPYGRLYIGRGVKSSGVFVSGYFQTMGLYEFTNSEFASVFLNHNFGNVLYNKRYSKPEFLLFHNMGIGALKNSDAHQGVPIQDLNKGFLESGAGFKNLIRLNYFNVAYFGFGASAFYRYGPYQLPTLDDNLVYRINFDFSF